MRESLGNNDVKFLIAIVIAFVICAVLVVAGAILDDRNKTQVIIETEKSKAKIIELEVEKLKLELQQKNKENETELPEVKK